MTALTLADIDATLYVRAPRLTATGATAFTTALLTTLPPVYAPLDKHRAAPLREAEAFVRTCLGDLGSEKLDRVRDSLPSTDTVDSSALDTKYDKQWKALHGRLASAADGSPGASADAQRADALVTLLFPDGLKFLNAKGRLQWGPCEDRLKLIAADKLDADIDRIAGEGYLSRVQATHIEYGQAFGITHAVNETRTTNISVPLRRLGAAIGQLGLQVLATLPADRATLASDHPLAVAVLRVLAEFDAERDRNASTRTAPTETPATPAAPGADPKPATTP